MSNTISIQANPLAGENDNRQEQNEKTSSSITRSVKQQPIPLQKEYFGLHEIGQMMGRSKSTIHRYCVAGIIKCVKINGKIFIRKKDIEEIFDQAAPYHVTPKRKNKKIESQKSREVKDTTETITPIPQIKTTLQTMEKNRTPPIQKTHKELSEWYSIEDIMQQYGFTKGTAYTLVSKHKIQSKKIQNKAYYSKQQIEDAFRKNTLLNSPLTEWYTIEEIKEKYDYCPSSLLQFASQHGIPTCKRRFQYYYSKKHFDAVMKKTGQI